MTSQSLPLRDTSIIQSCQAIEGARIMCEHVLTKHMLAVELQACSVLGGLPAEQRKNKVKAPQPASATPIA